LRKAYSDCGQPGTSSSSGPLAALDYFELGAMSHEAPPAEQVFERAAIVVGHGNGSVAEAERMI
jgi:hypothetical protein